MLRIWTMAEPRKRVHGGECRRDAVRMMREPRHRTCRRGTPTTLGVGTNLLHRWASKLEKDAVAKRNIGRGDGRAGGSAAA